MSRAEKFGAAMREWVDASIDFKKAAALAFNESARVTADLVHAIINGLPVDLKALPQDSQGCVRLQGLAAKAEVREEAAVREVKRLLGQLGGGQ